MKMCTIAQIKHSEEKLKDLSQVSGSPTAEMREKRENSKGGWEVVRDIKGKFIVVQPLIYSSCAAAAAKSLQSCPTPCDPIDGSPQGSPVPGILQARTLEWVAIAFSNAGKWKVKAQSRVLSDS